MIPELQRRRCLLHQVMHIIDSAGAADGGTMVCRVLLEDGSVLCCGLDCRIPRAKTDRTIFIGAGYPTEPGARTLIRNSVEEHRFIDELHEYARRTPSDAEANNFLRYILDR
jgi:hypothetical protein